MTLPFAGFADLDRATVAVPAEFLEIVAPTIHDLAELQVSLAVFRMLEQAGGFGRPISHAAILSDSPLRSAVRIDGSLRKGIEQIERGLELGLSRGTLLRFSVDNGGEPDLWYFLNSTANRARLDGIIRGDLELPVESAGGAAASRVVVERPTVFRLYEQNIGALTPLIADQIIRAVETNPLSWVEDAIFEAASYNRRSWRYIQRILETWRTSGRGDSAGGAIRNEATTRGDRRNSLDPALYRDGRHLQRAKKP